MIRPSSLIRSESHTPRIEANAINIKKESLDCGITAMRCCNTPACQKLGTSKLFVTLLIFVGIILGTSERYFQLSARQAAVELNFQPVEILDWLLVAHGIFQGIFAVILAYWGNRIHRISWIGGILMLQSALSLAVIIPILANNDSSSTHMSILAEPMTNLCTSTTNSNLTVERSYAITTLVLMFFLQFGIAAGNIVFFTLAFSYLDDNVLAHNSPALIAATLAARFWGLQWGSALNFGVGETSLGWWLGWAIISPILFTLAFLISLFPKRLLTTVVRQAADNIIEVATNNSQLSLAPNKLLADISFFSSMKRMVTNKILVFNVLATVFIETAIVNYFFHEKNYLQSRFLLPTEASMSISNEWTSRILTTMLKPPIVGLTILVGGLIIAKANPSPRKIAGWNVITASIVCILFVVYIFVDCNHNAIAGAEGGRLMHPFCSKHCICDNSVAFSPVCPIDSVYTYYSPCHAGCSEETVLNGQRIFSNCSCGVDTMLVLTDESMVYATDGACGFMDCQHLWIIFQALTVFGAALLGSGLIGNLIITIRCVLPQDKSLALSMELFLSGLIVYIPGKIVYRVMADNFCQYWSSDQKTCFLHESPAFGNVLNIVTAALIGASILFDVLVFIFVSDLDLYGEEIEDNNYRLIPMQTYTTNDNAATQQANIPVSTAEEQVQPLLLQSTDHRQSSPSQPSPHIYEHVTPYATIIPTNASPSNNESPQPSVVVMKNFNLNYAEIEFPSTSTGQQENLNFRFQTINDSETESDITTTSPNANRMPRIFGSDINPSVGDSSDRESDANVIRRMESSVSSLSGAHESSTSPPVRNKINVDGSARQRRPLSPETDF